MNTYIGFKKLKLLLLQIKIYHNIVFTIILELKKCPNKDKQKIVNFVKYFKCHHKPDNNHVSRWM